MNFFKYIKLPTLMIIVILFGAAYYLFTIDDSLNGFAGIGGIICVSTAIILSVSSFISNQIIEKYESIIKANERVINSLVSAHQQSGKSFRSWMNNPVGTEASPDDTKSIEGAYREDSQETTEST